MKGTGSNLMIGAGPGEKRIDKKHADFLHQMPATIGPILGVNR